ncbi:hypothetical protein CFC21_033771 [Triticum aestivum]|uniref:AAA+ ATPase domain-containing protein n=3 Tax=Triticum TaxID=4564 RepID=A0A3B6EA07_WHEAT|nr:hypothetical protein CFC21_033771 [Triticum aestivum]
MEGMVVSAVTGAMRTLLPKLAALLASKYKLSRGLSRTAELDEQQRDWRDKVRELSYDMEDCVDIFTHDLNGGHGGKAWLKRRLRKIKTRHEIASRIEELKARALEVSNCHHRYKTDECVGSPDCIPPPRGLVAIDPRMEALYVDANSLVGMDGPKEKLIKLLSQEQVGGNRLKVVAVVGSGGMGKTTLAHQVYTKIKSQFDAKAFITVSPNPSTVEALSDILQGFQGWVSSSLNDERKLIEELRKYLKEKRYLIVLDDIWAINAWNTIKGSFVENNLGSRVITTTQIEDVAKACCSCFHGHVYRIRPLSDLDSRRLFYRRVFYSDGVCPEQLKNFADEILKKCDGVPLAILSVASCLSSHEEVNSKETWEKMQNHFGFPLEGHPALEWMRHVLTLGYNDLSLELKTCLLYLGIFPKAYKIKKEDLVKRWISEGFITEKHGYSHQEIAKSYFSELINRNMIQIAEYDDCGHVLSCRVHDLMLDFIILKSTEENFITVIKEPPTVNGAHNMKGHFEFRRLSLQVGNSECTQVLDNTALTQARSLNFWGEPECMPCLSSFQLLRVLHLYARGDEYQHYDLSPICNFFQLSYLKIGGVHCEKQLRELHKLQHLKTLELASGVGSFRLDVSILPSTLCHLIVPTSVELFGEIGRMKALCTLVGFSILSRDVKSMKALGGLSNLSELELYLQGPFVPDSDSNYDSVYDALLLSLSRLGRLQSITFHGLARYTYLTKYVLTCWSAPPPSNLHRLHAQGFTFSIVPDWVAQLNQLRSLKIEVQSLLRDGVEVLARLTMLVHLTLFVREHVPLEGLVIRGGAFPNLKELWFRHKVPFLMFEAGAMPRVQSLTIECYAQAERQGDDSVLDGIEHLGSLETFKVYICNQENFSMLYPLTLNLSKKPHVEDIQRWDKHSIEAMLRKAINKHPGNPHVSIELV